MPPPSNILTWSSADSLFPEIVSHLSKIIKRYSHKTDRLDPKNWYRKLKSSQIGKNPIVTLIGRVKLHGVHADIVIDHHIGDAIWFRSRKQAEITLKNDVCGVVEKLEPLRVPILELRDRILARWKELNPTQELMEEHPIIIAGEWVGPGIFETVALKDLPRKVFVIISISINNKWVDDTLYADIDDCANDIYNVGCVGQVKVKLPIDEPVAVAEAEMMEWTQKVENRCPFAHQVFGIVGVGEGIVWKMEHPFGDDAKCWIKTKGPLHAETNATKLAALVKAGNTIDANVKAKQFAETICTEVRMEKVMMTTRQMCKGKREFGAGETGNFMQFLNKDILKEEMKEVEKQEVSTALLTKEVDVIAKKWFKTRMQQMLITPSVFKLTKGRRLGGN